MHILIGILGLLVAGYFWYNRARNAAGTAVEIADVANDVRLAARRFGFKRRTNIHPIDAIDDSRIAGSAIALAALEVDHHPTEEERNALLVALQSRMDLTLGEAEEMLTLSRWLIDQGGGPGQAATRLTRRLKKLAGREILQEMEALFETVARGTGGAPNESQQDMLDTLRRTFA